MGAVALPLAGLLADYVFEPLMLNPSAISRTLSYLVGTGPGSGMGLMFLLFGLLGIGQSIVIWSIGAFALSFLIPIASTSSQSIWQAKVPPGVQGRVFSARIMLGQIGSAVALPFAGLLADYVFEPLMLNPSSLSRALSHIVGSGTGSGMGLMFLLFGLLGIAATVGAYFYRPLRDIETLLPDCEAETEPEPAAEPASAS